MSETGKQTITKHSSQPSILKRKDHQITFGDIWWVNTTQYEK